MKKKRQSYYHIDHLELRRLLSTIYASSAATTGSNAGTSWPNAYTDLQSALTAAAGDNPSSSNPVVIEVGQGTYYPTATAGPRTATFQLIDDVSIQGGYAGAGTSNPDARDVSAYPTILSGDISTSGNSNNSYHVVYAGSGTDNTAVLDGFTITAGNANGATGYESDGGAILNVHSSPTISHCVISGNTASNDGGGICNQQDASPILSDCAISGNSAHYGGGIYDNHNSSPTLTNCTITGNTAQENGGGMYNNYLSDPTIIDSTFTGNSTLANGGAIDNWDSSPTLINCVINGNTAVDDGGAIENIYASSPTLTNCTISGDTATAIGGGIADDSSTVTLTNCILWDNTATTGNEINNDSDSSATIYFSDVNPADIAGTSTLDATDINADPEFVRNVGTNDASDFGNLHILGTSPAINAGSNAAIAGTTTDLDGNARIVAGTVDIGAYEAFATHLVISTQPASTDIAGSAIPIVIRVEDQYGSVFNGDNSTVAIALDNSPSGATLGGASSLATQNGVATFNSFFLTKAGSYSLTFSNGSLPVATSDTFTITAASPASLAITQQPGNATAGQDIPSLQVEVEDQYGNLADGSSVSVALSGSTGASLGGTSMQATTGGVASFSDLAITQAGTYTLSITDGDLPGLTSSSFMINPAAAAKLAFTIEPANATAGQTMPNFAVEVEDQYGNLVTNNTSTVAIASTPAGITTSIAATDGIAIFTGISTDTAGTFTLSASDGSLAGATSSSFTIAPGAAAQLVITQQPASTLVGQNIPFQVEVEDQYGNAVDGTSVTLALAGSAPSGAILAGTSTEPTAGGTAAFSDLSLNRAGTFTLSASDGNLPAVTSQSFTITYAGPQLVFITEPTSTTAGGKIPAFRISPEDINGKPLTSNKSKITIRSSAGKLLGTSTASVKNGVAIFKNLSFQQAGSYTFQVTDSGFGSALSSTITVSPAAAAKIVFTPQPSNVTHGTPFNVTVDLFDRYGNLATGNSSTVELTLGSHPKTETFTNLMATVTDGTADFDSAILTVPGNYTLAAVDGKLKAKSGKFIVD